MEQRVQYEQYLHMLQLGVALLGVQGHCAQSEQKLRQSKIGYLQYWQ